MSRNRKLLMIGGGFLQSFVIKKAREMGYEVHVVDGDPNAVGYQFADHYEVIDIKDEEGCLRYAREHKVDGVLTAATDFSVLVVSRVADEMGLPGLHYEAAKVIKNKAAYRNKLYEAKADDTGNAYELHSGEDIQNALKDIVFPVMVKPCDGSGSRGASKVERTEDFENACRFAMSGSVTHRAIAEPFIDGKEYGVESFVDNGEIHILAVMQKDMTKPPYYAELGHAIPSGLSAALEQKVKDCVRKALIALNVNHGSVNMDLLITESGNVHIVDIGARMGGNLIGSHIIPTGHRPSGDIDIYLFGDQKKADKLMRDELGIEIDKSHHHHTVFNYKGESVENHFDFLNVHVRKSNVHIEEKIKDIANTSCSEGADVILPSTEFNAIYLLRHCAAHFASTEMTVRQVLDWGFFMEKHYKEINWSEYMPYIKGEGMYRFYNLLGLFCMKYLGFDASIFHGLYEDALDDRFSQEILSPEFKDRENGNLLRSLWVKPLRWWHNRWKNRLCYTDSAISEFTYGLWAKVRKPSHFIQ